MGVMPKSNVYEPAREAYGTDDEPVSRPLRRVSIGWSKEGYGAQLGVGWTDKKIYVPDPKDDMPIGYNDTGVSSKETDEQGLVWNSQWIDLDRYTINHLIRELRKARDEAFGKDE